MKNEKKKISEVELVIWRGADSSAAPRVWTSVLADEVVWLEFKDGVSTKLAFRTRDGRAVWDVFHVGDDTPPSPTRGFEFTAPPHWVSLRTRQKKAKEAFPGDAGAKQFWRVTVGNPDHLGELE